MARPKSTPASTRSAGRAGSGARAKEQNDWRVRIRMYRKWLGDCFLLTFRSDKAGRKYRHVMIDCGALSGTPAGKEKITKAVEHIGETTDWQLDNLVVTHEHWDHISGFSDAADSFKKFAIEEVWAAWTEDPKQKIATEKKKANQLRLAAVESALRAWNDSGVQEAQQRGAAISALLAFMPAFSQNTSNVMESALGLGRSRKLLSPGETIDWSDSKVRVHVLGPPKDVTALKTTEGKVGADMYGAAAVSMNVAGLEAFVAAAQTADSNTDSYAPFHSTLCWDEPSWSRKWSHLADRYHSDPRRSIELDWLNRAAELALQLDNETNNTSLVLAFELAETKEVLLFVGDAQIGNWKSWQNVKFDDSGLTASDLLARTIFYKVGHHGSHNATLKAGGLEAMTSGRLVVAIPVDEEFAHRPKGGCPNGWEMPAAKLLTKLREQASGRVLRGDDRFPEGAEMPNEMTDKREWQRFLKDSLVDDLFIDYFVR